VVEKVIVQRKGSKVYRFVLTAAQVADRAAKKRAWDRADREKNPGKYRAVEAKRAGRQRAAKVRRELERRPCFGKMHFELARERRHFVVDDGDMSVWERMCSALPFRCRDRGDEVGNDAAARWLITVTCVT
jgi:hypothetical protein